MQVSQVSRNFVIVKFQIKINLNELVDKKHGEPNEVDDFLGIESAHVTLSAHFSQDDVGLVCDKQNVHCYLHPELYTWTRAECLGNTNFSYFLLL